MAIKTEQRGFALLVAVIFMSVMLALGLALSSLGYKQAILASSSLQSQYAFYAADAGLECALYADQRQNLFAYASHDTNPSPAMVCDGSASSFATISYIPSQWVLFARVSLDNGTHCADVTIYKPASTGVTSLFSQGYNVSCATVIAQDGARLVARGIQAHY